MHCVILVLGFRRDENWLEDVVLFFFNFNSCLMEIETLRGLVLHIIGQEKEMSYCNSLRLLIWPIRCIDGRSSLVTGKRIENRKSVQAVYLQNRETE